MPRTNKFNRSYGLNNPLQELFPEPVVAQRSPTANDIGYRIGQTWVDQTTNQLYGLASITAGAAVWSILGPGASDVDTLTGDTGGAISPTAGNINILGGDGLSVSGAGSTLTINRDAEGGFPITPYVVGPSGESGYQTVQAAIDAATAAGGVNVIWVQPGTYTEDLNITSSITFMSIDGVATITGQHTPPSTGAVTFDGFVLTSATNILNSNAAGSTVFNINNSFIIITNGYIFNLPNWTGEILMDNCGEASTNDGVINNVSGSSDIKLINVEMGAGTGNTMQLNGGGGFLRFDTCNVNCPVNMVGSGQVILQNGVRFGENVTIGGSLTGYAIQTAFRTGASQALTFNSSGNFSISTGEIQSTNDPAIGGTGAGTLTITGCSFPDNTNLANTLTISSGGIQGGNLITKYVVATDGTAPYTTIQSACDAANADGGGIVVVQPGDYTEDLTLYDEVHVVGLTFADAGGGVNITGVHTPPTTGGFVFNNVRLLSATHIFDSAAAGSSHLVIGNAEIFVTNGYTYNLPNWTGKLESFDVNSAVSTNDGFVNNTGGAEVDIFEASAGQGSGNTMITSGPLLMAGANIYCPVDCQTGTDIIANYISLNNRVTFSNNTTGFISNSYIASSGVSAVTMDTSGDIALSTCTIDTTNNPAIGGTGAGTLTFTQCAFPQDDNIAGTVSLEGGTALNGALALKAGDVTDFIGQATLVAGTVTVANTAVSAADLIFLSYSGSSLTNTGALSSTITASTSFTIESTNVADVNTVNYLIIKQK
jgi:hypothetical protein